MMMLVSFLAITAGFLFVIINDIKTFKKDMVETTLMNARLVGEYCVTPLDFRYDKAATEVLLRLRTIPTVHAGIVYDNDGKVFASFYALNESQVNDAQPPETTTFEFRNKFLHVYQPIEYSGEKFGTVYLKSSTEVLHDKIRNYLVTMGLLLFTIIFISFFIASNLQKIISKPIVNLAHATKAISLSADYSLRMKKSSDDEIGQLFDGFNDMLKQIELRDSELQQKNKELESLINTSPDAIIISDVNHRILIINKKFLDMCRIRSEDRIIGTDLLNYVKDGDTQIVSKGLNTVLESGNVTGIEFFIRQSENRYIPVELNASLLFDSNNNPHYIINIIRDVSERKMLEESIEKLRREHEAFMRHEIKNILFPIQGNAEVLLLTDKDKLDDEQKQYLQMIKDDSLRAGQLVDRIKMLQDMEKGDYTLNLQKHPLRFFIEKTIHDFKMLSEDSGVIIKYEYKECPDVGVDPDLIQGVFNNLIKNAIEHVYDCIDDNEKVVSISQYLNQGSIFVTINNKGEPIPPEKLKVFFEKFNSDRTKKKEGTGLGTSYAYLVTKAHGGDIFIESTKSKGTTVTLIFESPEY